jgi:hypothetical protein
VHSLDNLNSLCYETLATTRTCSFTCLRIEILNLAIGVHHYPLQPVLLWHFLGHSSRLLFGKKERMKAEMKDAPNQVKRVTKALRALQIQLSAFQNASPGERSQLLNGLLNASLVEDLRMTVDQLSRFFWCYVESAAANSDPEADYAIQGKRLKQIAEMLRLLHGPACPSENPLAFVERVTRSVDRHLDAANEDRPGFEHLRA